MEHGVVMDWNDMEQIWHYVFSKDQLQTYAEEVYCRVGNNRDRDVNRPNYNLKPQHPVLLTEAPLNPRQNRERAAEVNIKSIISQTWIYNSVLIYRYSLNHSMSLHFIFLFRLPSACILFCFKAGS
jgi:hypothetical protein